MSETIRDKFAGSYILWRIYHLIFSDVSSIMKIIREPLWRKEVQNVRSRCLDIGSGGGSYLKNLATKHRSALSIDLNPSSQANLAKRFSNMPGVNFVCCDASKLPIIKDLFDTVIAMEVLEHIKDDDTTLNEINRVMKKGALLIVTVPNSILWSSEHIDNDGYGHKRAGYTREEIERKLEEAGFSIKRSLFFFYSLSRAVFRFTLWFKEHIGIYPPFIVLLPVYIERMFIKHFRKSFSGANIFVLAVKN